MRLPSAWSCGHGMRVGIQAASALRMIAVGKAILIVHCANWQTGPINFLNVSSRNIRDPWAARDAYLPIRNGWESPESFWAQQA